MAVGRGYRARVGKPSYSYKRGNIHHWKRSEHATTGMPRSRTGTHMPGPI